MNDRITKIIIETLGKEGVIDSRAFGHWALSDEQLEKFAELIIEDCLFIVEDARKPLMVSRIELWEQIIEHFGIEE